MVAFAKNDVGRSALHIAAIHGHVESVELLLALKADPLEEDHFGQHAIDEAAAFDEVVELLTEASEDQHGRTPATHPAPAVYRTGALLLHDVSGGRFNI